jgi:hypothetical protein
LRLESDFLLVNAQPFFSTARPSQLQWDVRELKKRTGFGPHPGRKTSGQLRLESDSPWQRAAIFPDAYGRNPTERRITMRMKFCTQSSKHHFLTIFHGNMSGVLNLV